MRIEANLRRFLKQYALLEPQMRATHEAFCLKISSNVSSRTLTLTTKFRHSTQNLAEI
jgi:hypothetical protein